jgi:hypothetical protein
MNSGFLAREIRCSVNKSPKRRRVPETQAAFSCSPIARAENDSELSLNDVPVEM